jgi:membrane-bound lytic murein transglycosylase D
MDALETARAPAAEAEPEAAGQGAGRQGYRIRRGDTLGTIARRFGVSVAELQRANGIRGHAIHAGQRLDIPATAGRAGSPPGGETRLASAGFRGGKRGAPAAARMHTVARGDTLWQVSRRYDVTVDDLTALNGLARSAVLAPGQKLVVAKAAPAARAPVPGRSEAAPANTAGASTPGKGRTTPTEHYAVRSGDSLWTIARRFEVSVDDLCRWNGVGRKARLAVGQRLVVQSGDN